MIYKIFQDVHDLSVREKFGIKMYQLWPNNLGKRLLQIPALAGRLTWLLTR